MLPGAGLELPRSVVDSDTASEGSGKLGDPGCKNPVLVLDADSGESAELGEPGNRNPVLALDVDSEGSGELGEPGYKIPVLVLDEASEATGELGEPGCRNPVVLVAADETEPEDDEPADPAVLDENITERLEMDTEAGGIAVAEAIVVEFGK